MMIGPIRQFLTSLENPLFLSKRLPRLYWAIYRFSWSDYVWLLDNNLSRYAPVASAAGYLIYLNDLLTEKYGFDFVTEGQASTFGLDTRSKLVLIYFGLTSVALGRLLYLWRRPFVIRRGQSLSEWVSFGLQNFVYSDYLSMHESIQVRGHRSLYGKYYTDDWEAFVSDAVWEKSGRSDDMDPDQKRRSREHVGFAQAKSRHEDLLRSILIDRYYEGSATRKLSLLIAVSLSAFGSFLFLLPSVDLFFSILLSFF
jgi:hypothetical protein